MNSTNNDITNPTSLKELELSREISAIKTPTVVTVTQEFFDKLETPDPYTIYVIATPSGRPRIYYGSLLVSSHGAVPKYYMSINDKKEYAIYMYSSSGDLIELYSFDDPQVAINTLDKFVRTASHLKADISTREIVQRYMDDEIGLHDVIMGILTIYGFNAWPEFQDITTLAISYGVDHSSRTLPGFFVQQLPKLAKSENHLYDLYNKLYEFTLLDDFKNIVGDDSELVSKALDKIHSIFFGQIPRRI